MDCAIEYDGVRIVNLRHHIMRLPVSVKTYLFALFLSGCSYQEVRPFLPGIYTVDVNQGNIVSQEMIDQLKPGMNKRQVVFLMGTPIGIDPFHDNRWDYIYSSEPGGQPRVQKRVTLLFKADELASLQGDFRPGDLPSIETAKDTTVNIPPIERERTVWEKITGIFSF